MTSKSNYRTPLILILFLVLFVPSQFVDAAKGGGYRGYNTYPSKPANNFYKRDQVYRDTTVKNRQQESKAISAQKQAQFEIRKQEQIKQQAIYKKNETVLKENFRKSQKALSATHERFKEGLKKPLIKNDRKSLDPDSAKINQTNITRRSKRLERLVSIEKRQLNKPSINKTTTNQTPQQAKASTFTQTLQTISKSSIKSKALDINTTREIKSFVANSRSKDKNVARYNQQLSEKLSNKAILALANKNVNPSYCSFHGDTLVKTTYGFIPINQIYVGEQVWARDEYTGVMGWQSVTGLFSNTYNEVVEITIQDGDTLTEQTIRSNRIHPFYVPYENKHIYDKGTLSSGQWVESQNLKIGQYLLSDDENFSIITDINFKPENLIAYNISVDNYHSYFVKAENDDSFDPIWVHNDACPPRGKRSIANTVASGGGDVRVAKGLAVPKNLPKNIHPGQQGKHIPGHNNYTPGRSSLAEGVNPQKLLDGVQSGAHPIVRMTPRGQPVVDFGKAIGQFEGKATNFGIIHHGKKGAHIVPANPVQF